MAIYLDESQRTYLKQLLKKHPSDWWAHKKLLEQVEDEEAEIEKRKNCSHEFAEYIGKKTCCTKCQCFGENMGFGWTLKDFLEKNG